MILQLWLIKEGNELENIEISAQFFHSYDNEEKKWNFLCFLKKRMERII